jgi:hypothetical protein
MLLRVIATSSNIAFAANNAMNRSRGNRAISQWTINSRDSVIADVELNRVAVLRIELFSSEGSGGVLSVVVVWLSH